MTQKSTDRAKKFIKDNYKTIKVYIDNEDYPRLEARAKERGFNKINPYIKTLLQEDGALPSDADLRADEQAAAADQTPDAGTLDPGIKVAAR